jgi:hypothetical protein
MVWQTLAVVLVPVGCSSMRATSGTFQRARTPDQNDGTRRKHGVRDVPVIPQAQAAPEPRHDDIPPAEEGEPVRVVQEEIFGFWEEDFDRCIEGGCDSYHLC